MANIGTYILPANQTAVNFKNLYDAYKEYKAEVDSYKDTEVNPWLSDNASAGGTPRNAIWPYAAWENDAIWNNANSNGSLLPGNPMQGLNNAPNRMYAVIEAANQFIDQFLSLNDHNRIGVVVYDSVATELMPLAHYTKYNEQPYLSAEKHHWQSWGNGQWGSTVTATAVARNATGGLDQTLNNADGHYAASVTSWANTDTMAAINAGLDILAKAKNDYEDFGERLPVMVLMTDGAANTILTGGSLTGGVSASWTMGGTTSTDSDSMTAKYNQYDAFVLSNYAAGETPRTYNYITGNGNSNSPFLDKTTAGLTVYGAGNYHVYANEGDLIRRPVVFQTLMSAAYQKSLVEKNYKLDTGLDTEGKQKQAALIYTIGFDVSSYTDNTKHICDEILDPATYFVQGDGLELYAEYQKWQNDETVSLSFTPTANYSPLTGTSNSKDEVTVTISPNDLNDKDVTKADIERNINYPTQYFDASSAGDAGNTIESVFDQIITAITGEVTPPLRNGNGMGSSRDSITYMDPVGDYMQVQDVTNILLFGQLIKEVKTAVYDYQWNEAYLNAGHGGSGSGFTQGWYTGETGDKGAPCEAGTPGAVYRLDFATAQEFVPTLQSTESVEGLGEAQKNTVYTMYRMDGVDRDALNINPAYGSVVPDGAKTDPDYLTKYPGVYKLSDIRVWVEDTGNWYAENTSVQDPGFDEALYVDIPVNAIPLQVATISIDGDNNVLSYSTNLGADNGGDYAPSTPLRVFYSVSLEDEVKYGDASVDVSMLTQEYIDGHTDSQGRIFFTSNYYSGTSYTGTIPSSYGADHTYGNPLVSFTPSDTNRYYVFQKNLPLYWAAESSAEQPQEIEITAENGNIKQFDHYDESGALVPGEDYHYVTEVGGTSGEGHMNSDDWYYILAEYYMPGKDGSKGTFVQRAVPRRGSEFGSSLGGSITTGAYLCWYDASGNDPEPRDYSPSAPDAEPNKNWVMATRIHGLRTGNMSAFIGVKGSNIGAPYNEGEYNKANTTGTAALYYLPDISATSSDEKVVLNVYLGNNGRLLLDDTNVLVTKTVQPTGTNPVDPNEEFQFQVFASSATTGQTVNAIVVQRDPYSEMWRRRIDTIDVLTDPHNLLLAADGINLAVVDEAGVPINDPQPNQGYYVWLGPDTEGGSDEHSFGLYAAPESTNRAQKGGYTIYVATQQQLDEANAAVQSETVKYALATESEPAGSVMFWASDEVHLIPVGELQKALDDNWDGSAHYEPGFADEKHIKSGFRMATLRLDQDEGLRCGVQLTSAFSVRSTFLTKEVKFGLDSKEKLFDQNGFLSFTPETIYPKTAQFNLKDGEGLLFTGLANDSDYRVTEKLTDSQVAEGYTLDKAQLVRSNNYIDYVLAGGETSGGMGDAAVDGYFTFEGGYNHLPVTGVTKGSEEPVAAYFSRADHYYSVYGDTSSMEEAAHFTNTFAPKTLTIKKLLSAAEGATLTAADWNTKFYFSAKIDLAGNPAEYPVTFPLTRYKANNEPYPETAKRTEPIAIDLEDEASESDLTQDAIITGYVQVDKDGNATFMEVNGEGKLVPLDQDGDHNGQLELLPGEWVVIYGLPVDTGYSFSITEDRVNGYVPKGEFPDGNYTISGSVGGEGQPDMVTVIFDNVKQAIKPAYVSLSATKTLNNKELADKEFTFEIAPVAGNPAGDPIAAPRTVYNGLDGLVQLFNEEPYAQLGEYNYTVREVIPNPTEPGIIYDTTIHMITVKIEPQGEGEHYTSHLQAKLEIDGKDPITGTDEGGHYTFGPATIITFDNNYEPGIATAVLQARKLYLGGEMEGNEFTFTLTPVTAQVGEPESSPEPAENEEQGSDLEIAPPSNGGEQQEQPGAGDPADPEASASPEPSATAEPTPVTPAEPENSDAPEATAAPEVDPNEQDGPSYTSLEPGDGTEGDPAPTDPDQEPAGDPAPDGSENTETPAPTDTPAPSDTPEPSETPEPTDTAEPTETPEATQTPEATETPAGEPEGDPDDNEIMPIATLEPEGMPMPDGQGGTAEGKNDKFGNVIFGSIKFKQAGVYYYQITEQPDGAGDNIEYDKHEFFAKVTVTETKAAEGDVPAELIASVEYLSSMDPEVLLTGTPQFTNINTKPVKTEPDPGPDMPVQVGDVVTYRVTWYNNEAEEAKVTVVDKLDRGVTYNAGTAVAYRYVVDDAGNVTELQIGTGTYSSDDHAITWVLEKQPSMATGYVEFKVTVNENAKYKWDYNKEEEDTGEPPTGPSTVDDTTEDFRIVNRAALNIDDGPWQWTEKIPNPTWEPEKGSAPKSETTVHVGDVISYWITWQNYLTAEETAQITVTDVLDPGVTYVDGSAKAFTGVHEEHAEGTPLTDEHGTQIRGIYDPYTHTITWDLGKQPKGASGYVMFQVTVNNDALQDDATVKNRATVEVDNNSFQTNEVEHYVDGRLLVTKYVSGNSGETTRDFHFTVTLTPPTGDQALIDFWNEWDGSCVCTRNDEPLELKFEPNEDHSAFTATFTLHHNQTASINGLPVGAGYTVTETDANSDGYTTTYERATGTIGSGDSTPHAVITNTKDVYTPPPGPDGTPEPSTTPTPSTSPSPSPTPDGQPHKVETDPGDGQMVVPDQWVTYEITWENTHAESATVTIWDTLDPNVEFVSASEGYTYDPATHTVTWVLPDRAGGSTGSVTVTVRVLPSAVQAGIIRNQAHVQVGDDPAQDTEIPENPLTPPSPSPVAPSPTPSSGIPDTGDSSHPGLWLALLTVSLMGLGLIGGATLRRRKREK